MICVLLGKVHENEHYVCHKGTPRRVHIQTKPAKVSIYKLKEYIHTLENHALYEYECTLYPNRIDGFYEFYKPF